MTGVSAREVGRPEPLTDAQQLLVIANRLDGLLEWLGDDHPGHHMIRDMPRSVCAIAVRALGIAPSVVVDRKALERAHKAYERYGQMGDMKTMRLSDGCIRAIITAALKAAP